MCEGQRPGGSELPFIDENGAIVSASAQTVWDALARQFMGLKKPAFGAYVRVISGQPHRATGQPLDLNATVPGFRVDVSMPPERVELTGSHRFSRYRLVFALTKKGGETVLSARTYASFPGLLGFAYQGLVIRSGAHRMMTRRLLVSVRNRAERWEAGANQEGHQAR